MSNIYYILAAVSYGIFLVQFILSWFGGDSDLDVDLDGDVDFDVNDLVSFKGLIHFLMGFSGWMVVTGKVSIINCSIAVLVGLMFVFILYWVYKLCMSLHSEPTVKQGNDLIGESVIVYAKTSDTTYVCILMNVVPYREMVCQSDFPLEEGEIRKIDSFESGIYKIS